MPNSQVIRGNSRQTLLDAAQAIIMEKGVGALTLEGVAEYAGVTKGGLIYHFKTREVLLLAVVERIVAQIEAQFQREAEQKGQTLEAWLLVLIDHMFGMSEEEKTLMSNLLAAVSSYPNQLGPVQQMYERITASLTRDPAHIGLALTVSCALDGILFLELLNIKHFSPDERAAMRQSLIDSVIRATRA